MKLWIDCDPGVDDAAALLVANRLPELEIVGVSTVAGNVPLPQTTENARKLRALMGADWPIYPGTEHAWMRPYGNSENFFHGRDGLGGAELPLPQEETQSLPAWEALYQAARQFPGLTVATLGPMTNLATALTLHEDLKSLLSRIVFMGGAAVGGNCTPCAEFNIHADAEAAQAVMRSGVPLVMCGLDVTLQCYVTQGEIQEIASAESPVTRFFRTATPELLQKNMAAGLPGLALHDVVPVLYLAHPEYFSGREAGVYVETQGTLTYGKTVNDLYSDKQFPEKNALVLLHADRAAFLRELTAALQAYGL